MFVDSHAHLEMEQFDADREQMIARAREAGIEKIVAIGSGTGPGSLDCGIQLAEQHEFIYATIGIHPHEAKLATDADFQELEQLAKRPKVIAWGEIGLDYFYDHSPRELQQQVFLRQMELARAAKLPIVIHCRPSDKSENAWDDCLRLIQEHWAIKRFGRRPALLHRNLGACPAGARYGIHDFLRRKRHLSQSAADPRRRKASAARPHADRNRFAVSGAGARIAASATSRRL